MGILGAFREKLDRVNEYLYAFAINYGEKKKIKDVRRRKLLRQVTFEDEQRSAVDSFFQKNYGKKMSHDWHRLYQSFTGKFQVKYFPEILFSSKYELMVNPRAYRYVMGDKILLPIFCCNENNVRIPETFATYCNGVYFNASRQTMTVDQLASYLGNLGKLIIKPTQGTSSGEGVRVVSFVDGYDELTRESVHQVLSEYSACSFIIQGLVKPHIALKTLYPDAVNTLRIVTYLWKGEVCHWPITLRLGQGGSFLDNAHAGGMFINVSGDGVLSDKAFTEFQKVYTEHPDTHVVFDGYKLDFIPEVLDAAKRMHLCAPQLGIISWDLTVDEDGRIVLIEVNTASQTIWFPQMASGEPAFGDNTEDILKYIGER